MQNNYIKTTSSHNFAFCMAEYLQNRYHFLLDEKICYILGCSWGLHILSRSNSIFLPAPTRLNDLSTSYLEAFNPQAFEYFITNLRAIYRIDHNNDISDARWIASDYHNLGKIKTFVSLSNSLLGDNIVIDNQPIYGVAYMDEYVRPGFEFDQIKEGSLQLEVLKNYTIKLPVQKFTKYWKIDNCEMFNANRYVIISPQFKSLHETLPGLIGNALRMNYFQITNETILSGSRLLMELMKNLKKSPSQERVKEYIEFFFYSLRKNSLLGGGDMDRQYLSKCFECLSNLGYIKNTSIVDIAALCGRCWNTLYGKIQKTDKIVFSELYDMIREVTEAESALEKMLGSIVKV